MLSIVAPGQGAQTPGFLTPWLSEPRFATRLKWLGAVAGIDMEHYGTDADAETIRDTAIAQPLLVAAALACYEELFDDQEQAVAAVGVLAGHSVGELAAAALAGIVSAESAMVLVRERGLAMAEASRTRPTSMTAVIGGKPEEVLAAIDAIGLTPANNNGRGQIVAAGTVEQLEALAANPPQRARLIPLSVAGAFHTVHMQPAVSHLRSLAEAVHVDEPSIPLLSNSDGTRVANGRDALDRIVGQVANPVRWDLCMDTMTDMAVTGLLELTPSGTLTGIAKRNLAGVELFSLNTPDQIPDAKAFIAEHAGSGGPIGDGGATPNSKKDQ